MTQEELIRAENAYVVVTGHCHPDMHTQYSNVKTGKQHDADTHMYARKHPDTCFSGERIISLIGEVT